MAALVELCQAERLDAVLAVGDLHSPLAGSIAAKKLTCVGRINRSLVVRLASH